MKVSVAGEELSPEEFVVDHDTGIISVLLDAVPQEGQEVRAGYAFDVPARFDTERLAISLTAFKAGQIPSIPIVEIAP